MVGFVAGAPLQVSGPAAGLSVIVWDLIQRHGFEALGWIVLVAGVVQVVAGLAGIGQWFRAVSPAVIHGMLAGIGVLIFASQFHVMVDDAPRGSGIANLLSIPQAVVKGIVPADGSVHFQAAMIGMLTLVTIVSWRLAPRAIKFLPAPLIAVIVATAVAALTRVGIARVQVPANLIDAMQFPELASFSALSL